MPTLFGKKRISEEKVANIVVNGLLDAVETNFPDVAALIATDPDFVTAPEIDPEDDQEFLMVVITGNLKKIPEHFESGQDERIKKGIVQKFAQALDIDPETLEQRIGEYSAYLSRVNHPSKKTLYAMSKAVFHLYGLNPYQQEYFRKIETPNPLFLQRLDEVMENFLWSWGAFLEKYKVQRTTE